MKILFGIISALILAASAHAERPARPLPNDPKRPTLKISHDLQVTQSQFVTCFENVQPAEQGRRPSQDKVHASKTILLGCLQKANPAITNEKLDEVMDRYRPGGHQAQVPQD